MNNIFRIYLDIDKSTRLQQPIVISQGDKSGTTISAYINSHGTLLTQEGLAARFKMRLPDGKHFYSKNATWVAGTGNAKVVIDETQAASVPGTTHEAYFELVDAGDPDDVIYSTNRFSVRILRSATEAASTARSYDDRIDSIIVDIEGAQAAAEAANAAATSATAAASAANTAAAEANTAKTAANNAATAAGNAANSATTAAGNANSAASDANSATTSARSAASQATSAATDASNAASAATTAATDAASAATAANAAAGSVNAAKDAATAAATAANSAAASATSAAASANDATTNATDAATAANDAATSANDAAERAEDAIEAMGDISEIAVPLMSPTTRGGAKLGHGLTVEDGALGIGEVTDPTDAGPIVELTAKGWATQDGTPSPSYPQEVRRVTGHTISGKTGRYVDVDVQGRNLLDVPNITTSGGGNIINQTAMLSEGTYTLSFDSTATGGMQFFVRDVGAGSQHQVTLSTGSLKAGRMEATFTIDASVEWIRFYVNAAGTYSNIQLERGSVAHAYEPYAKPYSITIPLPERGWVAALPDGTADTLALDGAGGYTWELNTNEVVLDGATYHASYVTVNNNSTRVTITPALANYSSASSNINYILSDRFVEDASVINAQSTVAAGKIATYTNSQMYVTLDKEQFTTAEAVDTWLQSNPVTVIYPLATPTTERGYVEMPTVPIHATLTTDLHDLIVRCCADDGAAEIAAAWGKRYVETSTEMQSDVAEIATGLATLEDDVADLSASIADLTDVVAYHDERIERNASDIASMRKSLLRRESDGYYDNQSVTAFLSAKFDGRLYGYSEPKTTATEVTKTGANAGITNPTLGTATVAGTSEYRDLGPFQWFAAKGYVDADGVPHVKTIRGIDSDADWDACTDNVWSLRPVVWYSVDESGSSVIGSLSDTWHLGLSPNPQAYLPDGTLRPYMLAARYALGFENGVGVSKSGLRGYGRDVSHNSLITKLGYASSGYSGKSIYEQWYDVFMSRMIYGTKDFQTVMQGCTSYNYQYNPAVAETGVKRVILANAQAAGLLVGSTMMLGTRVGASSNDRNQANNFDVFDGARITAIEEYDANNKAVYFDVDETFDTDPTYLLSTAPWHSGSCDAMDWDGSPTSPQSAKEVAFFQGCELMHGAAEILAGVIISNDGVTGWTPYVVHDTRDDATSLTEDFVSCGAALPTNDSDGWKYPLYVSDHGGLMYGTTTGGSTTTGASDGHYTNKLSTTGVREWRSSGHLTYGRNAGLSFVDGHALGYSGWTLWSRLSGTGRSRG